MTRIKHKNNVKNYIFKYIQKGYENIQNIKRIYMRMSPITDRQHEKNRKIIKIFLMELALNCDFIKIHI